MPHHHFELELAALKRSLATMGNLVDQALTLATEAIILPNTTVHDQSQSLEHELDSLETEIEARCHDLIALQAPVAGELRLVIAGLQLSSKLEQIGDLAESVAKRAAFIARHQPVTAPEALPTLARLTLGMVRQAQEAFLTGQLDLATAVQADEPAADRLTKQCYESIQESMARQPERIREYTHLLRAVSRLEAIADLAASISDEAVYLHRGALVRHQHKHLRSPTTT